jgi:hypothetical protein
MVFYPHFILCIKMFIFLFVEFVVYREFRYGLLAERLILSSG